MADTQKKKFNGKLFFCIASVIFVVALIVVVTIWNAGIDVEKWSEKEFISNLLINTAISVFGMIAGIGLGDNHYRTKENGLYLTSYNNFQITKTKIENHLDKFPFWIRLLHKKELNEKCIRYLKDGNGITQAKSILMYLDRADIEHLLKPFKKVLENGKEIHFKSLTQTQIDAIYNVFDGKIKVKFIHDSYFLNALSKNENKSMYEMASEEQKRRAGKTAFLFASKVLLGIAMSLIFAGLTLDVINGADIGTMLINIFSRLSILASSLYSGFSMSSTLIKDECLFIDFKTTTLEKFNLEVVVNKTVVCLTEEQEAEQEFKIYEEEMMQSEQQVGVCN